jgi:hypothetical protein
MNEFDVITPPLPNYEPIDFYNNLPNVTSAFELTQLPDTDYYGFYDGVFNQQHVGSPQPYRYGSYQIY